MISNFLLQKAMPVCLGLLGVSCIDTPHNFVRRVLFDIFDTIATHFESIFRVLN